MNSLSLLRRSVTITCLCLGIVMTVVFSYLDYDNNKKDLIRHIESISTSMVTNYSDHMAKIRGSLTLLSTSLQNPARKFLTNGSGDALLSISQQLRSFLLIYPNVGSIRIMRDNGRARTVLTESNDGFVSDMNPQLLILGKNGFNSEILTRSKLRENVNIIVNIPIAESSVGDYMYMLVEVSQPDIKSSLVPATANENDGMLIVNAEGELVYKPDFMSRVEADSLSLQTQKLISSNRGSISSYEVGSSTFIAKVGFADKNKMIAVTKVKFQPSTYILFFSISLCTFVFCFLIDRINRALIEKNIYNPLMLMAQNLRKHNDVFSGAGSDDEAITDLFSSIGDVVDHYKRKVLELKEPQKQDGLTKFLTKDAVSEEILRIMDEGKKAKNTAIQIDVNELKWINDTYGELAGDDVIREMSSRLRRAIEDQQLYSDVNPYMARISGSSFLIVLEDTSGFNIDNMMSRLIPNLKASVDGDYAINLSAIKISTLIGVVSFPDDAWDLHGLWNLLRECVSIAEVKSRKGSPGIHLYEKIDEFDTSYGRIDHDKLKRAIDSSEVGVLFKPIISTADRRAVAAEVFPSWSYSSGAGISVNNIKMAAEESGLISVLNEYILEKACVVAAGWFRSGYRKIKIICPLSRRQIYEGSISDRIGRIIKDTGMDPNFIELQIAESELFSDNEVFNEKLRGLNDLGIKIVVSKFGSGKMSVLQLLTGGQISGIKLDPSITSNAGTSSKADALCESLIDVCGALKLNLLVEGIEGDHDFEYLKGLGFTIFQGPKLSKPLQPKDFEQYFKIVFDKKRSILRLDVEAARRR